MHKRFARVLVADDVADPVLAHDAREPLDGRPRVEGGRRPLVEHAVEHEAPGRVAVSDGAHGIVAGPAAHIHEGDIGHAGFGRPGPHATGDSVHDRLHLERGALGEPAQVEMQAAVLVRGKAPLLLGEIVRVLP